MISIIVPVYNAAPFLEKCIKSLLAQSYTDYEIILINDGSTDDSLIICKKYASDNSQIRVFSQENKGVSAARNFGISQAKGKLISFVDADDWVEPKYLKVLIQAQEKNNSDLTIGLIKAKTDSGWRWSPPFPILELKPEKGFFAIDELVTTATNLQAFLLRPAVYPKLYKREILIKHQIKFKPDLRLGEDSVFVWQYGLKCKTVAFLNEYIYCSNTMNSESATRKYNSNLYDDQVKLGYARRAVFNRGEPITAAQKAEIYFTAAARAVWEEGSAVKQHSFFKRYRRIKEILNKEEVKTARKTQFKMPKENKAQKFISVLMRWNFPFLVTLFMTVLPYFVKKK